MEVLEARDRVGGRTWSRLLDNGAVVEMGAEFILPDNTAIRSLAAEFGVDLWAKGVRYGRRDPRGVEGVDRKMMIEAAAVVEQALHRLPAESTMTAAELLDTAEIDPGSRRALRARVEMSSASGAEGILAGSLDRLGHVDEQPSPSLAGGNQSLSIAMARSLGPRVRLDDAVVTIEWGSEGVLAVTASGHEVRAARCVLALPAGVTGRIDFEPGLPAAKAAALAAVNYGHAAKLFVPLGEPAPVSAVMNVPECYWCWTETGEADQPMPLVSCFAGSPAALAALEVESGPEKWLDSLTNLRPDLDLRSGEVILSTWDDDPWVAAAYSTSPSAELTSALRQPAGPFVFAGEHTAGEFHGLMEGAVRSGITAAGQIS